MYSLQFLSQAVPVFTCKWVSMNGSETDRSSLWVKVQHTSSWYKSWRNVLLSDRQDRQVTHILHTDHMQTFFTIMSSTKVTGIMEEAFNNAALLSASHSLIHHKQHMLKWNKSCSFFQSKYTCIRRCNGLHHILAIYTVFRWSIHKRQIATCLP